MVGKVSVQAQRIELTPGGYRDRVGAELRGLQIVMFGDKSFGWPDETTQHLGRFGRGQEGHGTPARDEPRSLGDCRAKLGLNAANEGFGQTASMYE